MHDLIFIYHEELQCGNIKCWIITQIFKTTPPPIKTQKNVLESRLSERQLRCRTNVRFLTQSNSTSDQYYISTLKSQC